MLRFQLTAAFRTRVVMLVPIMAVPLNFILNWVLIFGHWGLPALGSAGSGCATAIVQWLTLASFAAYMLVAKAAMLANYTKQATMATAQKPARLRA